MCSFTSRVEPPDVPDANVFVEVRLSLAVVSLPSANLADIVPQGAVGAQRFGIDERGRRRADLRGCEKMNASVGSFADASLLIGEGCENTVLMGLTRELKSPKMGSIESSFLYGKTIIDGSLNP
jgi:hypothetical protein